MVANQKGFTLVAGLLILVAIGLVGGTGYYVYNAQKAADQALTKANQDNAPVADQTPAQPATDSEKGFVTIKEWGVTVRIGAPENSSKLSYKIQKDEQGNDTAYFILSPSITQACPDVGFAVHKASTSDSSKYTKIGDGYYAASGAAVEQCAPGEEKAQVLLKELSDSIGKMDYEIKAAN